MTPVNNSIIETAKDIVDVLKDLPSFSACGDDKAEFNHRLKDALLAFKKEAAHLLPADVSEMTICEVATFIAENA